METRGLRDAPGHDLRDAAIPYLCVEKDRFAKHDHWIIGAASCWPSRSFYC
jgi:hypothetical protein